MRVLLCSLLTLFYVIPSSGLQAQPAEILILGVSQDAGHPQLGCDKSCCDAVFRGEYNGHMVTSIAIANKEQFFLIDASPDIRQQLFDAQDHFKKRSFGGVFLTHAHMGHYAGMIHFGREAMSTLDLPVYAMPRMKAFLESNGPWDQLVKIHNIDLHPLKDGEKTGLDELQITPFTVPHRDEYSETVGYRIDGPNASLVYIPDIDKWERWDLSMEELIAGTDYLLIDGTFFDAEELAGRNMAEIPHPFVVETMARLASLDETQKSKVYFTHFNHTNPLLIEGSDARKAVETAGFNVAYRGLRFQL